MLLTPAQIKPKSFESRRTLFYFTRGGCVSCLHGCLGAGLLPQSYQYQNFLESADQIWHSLEEGAGKRCWECGLLFVFPVICCCDHQLLLLAECQINTNPGTASGRQGADTLGYSLFPVICCCDHQLLLLAECPCTEFRAEGSALMLWMQALILSCRKVHHTPRN